MPKPRNPWYDPLEVRKDREEDIVTCGECGCQWMELVAVQQYLEGHSVILGQKPPVKQDTGFWIFRCPKCGETYEPRIIAGPQDRLHKQYAKFVEIMTEKDTVDGEEV